MVSRLDVNRLADDLQLLGKFIQHPATGVPKEHALAVIRFITRTLERLGAEINRAGVMSGTADASLTLCAARELELYVCGEKTQICNRHMAEVYYRVLCAGLAHLPR